MWPPGVDGAGHGSADRGQLEGRGFGKKAGSGGARLLVAGSLLVAIIREMNERVFALNFFETGGIGLSESREKAPYSTLSTGLASPALHSLNSVISDCRPPGVTESGEAALRRLLASCATGGCSLTSDELAPGSLTVFQSSRVARPQDASKALNLVSQLSSFRLIIFRCFFAAHVSSCFCGYGTSLSLRRSSFSVQPATLRGFLSVSGQGWFRRGCRR